MPTDIAIVDGGSFVLPYDLQLVRALAGEGMRVGFFGSTTRYNGECLDAMRALPNVQVQARAISGSVTSRWQGALAYARLWLDLLARRPRIVNLQFSAAWFIELPFLIALRRRFVFTIHNAVPHGFQGRQHGPTRRLARLARTLVFISPTTRDDFLDRYGQGFAARSVVAPHGLLPIAPGRPPVAYRPRPKPRALVYWSTVKPYKGVELFAELARDPRIRSLGLSLEVHGKWSPGLAPLRTELSGLGVKVEDRYLDVDELEALLSREDALFVLPYREASQSGALYTLLHHGCRFVSTDVGDLGAFMRRFGLEGLLLREAGVDAVIEALDFLRTHEADIAQALQRAQQASGWTGAAATYRAMTKSAAFAD